MERIETENTEKTVEKTVKNVDKTSLVEAVKSGNRKKTLIALRDKLAEMIDGCESGRDLAANSKRLMEVMAELEEIKAAEKAKREKRKAAKKPSKREQLRQLNDR